MRVLIAEDERRLAEAIARGLRGEGMAVDLAPDGTDALVKARVVRYDVVVLDRDLPGVHGDEVCRAVRDDRPETGIVMLTAAGALEDRVEVRSLGAGDYRATDAGARADDPPAPHGALWAGVSDHRCGAADDRLRAGAQQRLRRGGPARGATQARIGATRGGHVLRRARRGRGPDRGDDSRA